MSFSFTEKGMRVAASANYFIASFVATFLTMTHALAAPLSIDNEPLFVQNAAKSNLMLVIDDSGSMEAETLYDTSDGALWYKDSSSSFIDSITQDPYFETSTAFLYLFPNGTGNGNRKFTQHKAVPPLPQYAFSRSYDFNPMYYNPYQTYTPWESEGNTTYTDMPADEALSDPVVSTSSKLNLIDIKESHSNAWTFFMGKGAILPAGVKYYDDGNWITSAIDIEYTSAKEVGIAYYPATYYVTKNTGAYSFAGTSSSITGDCASPNPLHYREFEDNPVYTASGSSSVIGTDIHALAYDGSCLTRVEIKSGSTYASDHNGARACSDDNFCTYEEEKQNFANWFSYSRKRHLALRAGMGAALADVNDFNAGYFTINNRSDVSMKDLSDTVKRKLFFDDIYRIGGTSGGTPNRLALDHAGRQYMRTGLSAPIQHSCQKNFTLLFTDGYTDTGQNPSGVGDYDGTYAYPSAVYDANDDGVIDSSDDGFPYKDTTGSSNSLADIALKYYTTELHGESSFDSGSVPVDAGCDLSETDPRLDCNSNLHMNTFTIGMGFIGKDVYGITHNQVADAYVPGNSPAWPSTNVRNATQIDDLYHAAVNGRGEMFNATSGVNLADQLQAAVVSIQSEDGSASSVSFNTATLEEDSNVFLALFNPARWAGDLQSFSLTSSGEVETENWSAAESLENAAPSSRTILTYNGSEGTAFQWGSLTSDQQDDLNASSCSTCTHAGQSALSYLRGDQSKEGVGDFRVRESLLGDIVNGGPVYVGLPNLDWPAEAPFPVAADETYAVFKSNQRTANPVRDAVVYVGANDGMLHGFIASDNDGDANNENGKEVLAYIPSMLFSSNNGQGLHALTDPSYNHLYYVDQTPAVADVYIQTDPLASSSLKWRTLLVGGLGAGGRGLYALDVTDPSLFSESNAEDIVLWEFSSAVDSDLGYTFAKPTIAMMENGRWAAVFGNGYNSDDEQAKLFIVFLDGFADGVWTKGTDYLVIETDTQISNGLSSVRLLDIDGNGAADRAYAGDLQGRLWAFDLSHKANTGNWSVAHKQGSNAKPLFTAGFTAEDGSGNPQAITSKPSVVFHPSDATTNSNEPNLLVFFGTGQFFSSTDINNSDVQTFYGIRDRGAAVGEFDLERNALQEQEIKILTDEILIEDETVAREFRGISSNKLISPNDNGWYIDLPSTGERVVVDSITRGSVVFFNTWIPSTDACAAGGTGYLMSVSQATGGAPPEPVFDTTFDDKVKENDKVDGEVAVGQEYTSGLPSAGKFLSNKQFVTGTGTNQILTRKVEDLGGATTGRLSWQELNT